MGLTDASKDAFLDEILGNSGGINFPDPVFLAASTTTPLDDGTNFTEPAALDGYARVSITNNVANWPNATNGLKASGAQFAFPAATNSWGTITHIGLYDVVGVGAGNLLIFFDLTTSLLVSAGVTLVFPSGNITIQVTNV